MATFKKNRSINAPYNGTGSSEKWRAWNFNSYQEMRENEIKMMKLIKTKYPYVPDVISSNDDFLEVSYVEGKLLNLYIQNTHDYSILDKLNNIFNWLRLQPLEDDLYFSFWDYNSENFLVDKDNNIWILDFDTCKLVKRSILEDDIDQQEAMINYLKMVS